MNPTSIDKTRELIVRYLDDLPKGDFVRVYLASGQTLSIASAPQQDDRGEWIDLISVDDGDLSVRLDNVVAVEDVSWSSAGATRSD